MPPIGAPSGAQSKALILGWKKVKGHITEAEVAHDALLKWKREGNRCADRLAKMGARAHYTSDQWADAKAAIAKQEEQVNLCEWIGIALSEWPPEKQVRRAKPDRDAMRKRRQARRDAARQVGGHRMAWGRDGWKCQDCGAQARTHSGASRLANRPCRGHLTTRIPKQGGCDGAAHRLWTAEAENDQGQGGANVTWCAVCGAYSSSKLYKLRGRCSGQAQGAALTRLRALQSLRHPVHGYRLARPHRMTDLLMDIMVRQARERAQKYEEVFKAHPDDGDSQPRQDEAEPREGAGLPMSVPAHMQWDDLGDTDGDYDVFGHGGDLGTQDGDNMRLVPSRPSASSDSLRAVPHGLADGGWGDAEPASTVTPEIAGNIRGRALGPTPRLVSDRHSADYDGEATRAVLSGPAAGQKRGTKVWAWQQQFGRWRWVAASEACEGKPCICALSVTFNEIRDIITRRGIKNADDARKAQEEIEEARHARRREERRAMTEEDADIEVDMQVHAGHAENEASKRRRIFATDCERTPSALEYGEVAAEPVDSPEERKRRASDRAEKGAAKHHRITSTGPTDAAGVASLADEVYFVNRRDLLDALRGGELRHSHQGRSGGDASTLEGRWDPLLADANVAARYSCGIPEGFEDQEGGTPAKRPRRHEGGASSSGAVPIRSIDGAGLTYRSRAQLIEELGGSENLPCDDRRGVG